MLCNFNHEVADLLRQFKRLIKEEEIELLEKID